MNIVTPQDALDWLACNIDGYAQDYIAIIKLQALINRTEEPKNVDINNIDLPKLHKILNDMEAKKGTLSNQITLKQQLLTITHQNYKVYLKDVNAMDMTRLIYDSAIDDSSNIQVYLDYVVESLNENWEITIKGQKIV